MRGLEYPHQLEISVDGERVHLASFGGDKEIAASSDNPTTTGDDVDGRFTARVPLKAGPRRIASRSSRRRTRSTRAACRTTCAAPSDTIDFSGYPAHRRGDPHRSVQSDRTRRHAEPPPHLRLPAQGRRRRGTVRDAHPEHARAPRLSRRLHRRRSAACCSTSSAAAATTAGRSRPASIWRCAVCWPARSSSSASSAIRRRGAGRGATRCPISSSRRGCRSSSGAAFRTTSCSTLAGRKTLREPGDARAAGAPDARRPQGAGARRQLPRPVAAAAQPAQQAAELARVPRLRRQPAPRARHRDRAVLRLDRPRGPQRPRPDDGRLHVRQRAAGQALRHPERLRQPLPPRHARRRQRARACSARARS